MHIKKWILESTKHCNGKWVCVLSDFLLEMEHLRLSLVHPKHKGKHSNTCSVAHFQFIDLCRKIIGLQKSKQWKYMQKAISNSRRLYKYAKRNKLLFFLTCVFFFFQKFSWTSFLMIQMTKDWFNKSFLCIYYMLWNTSRKKFQKSCWEMSLFTIWTRNSYKREGKGSTFRGISEPNKETKIKAALQASKFLRTTKAANEFLQKA